MNEDADLVRMANNIAANFAVYPEAEAIAAIVRHVTDFWPRPMRDRSRATSRPLPPLRHACSRPGAARRPTPPKSHCVVPLGSPHL